MNGEDKLFELLQCSMHAGVCMLEKKLEYIQKDSTGGLTINPLVIYHAGVGMILFMS